jgi:ATP/maltotriose-dependent transcriptional regulator MalT
VDPLTARELTVLELVEAGLSNIESADCLVVSETTVRTHVSCHLVKIYARSCSFSRSRPD